MTDSPNRLIDPEARPDDRLTRPLRPKTLTELIGQEQLKENLHILIDAARSAANRWTTSCFYGPPPGQDQPWRMCWPTRWASISRSPPPALEKQATWRHPDEPAGADILFIDEIHRLGKPSKRSSTGDGGLRPGHHHRQGAFRPQPATQAAPLHGHGATTRLALISARCRPVWSCLRLVLTTWKPCAHRAARLR